MISKVNFVELQYADARISFFDFIETKTNSITKQWHKHIYYELHFSFDRVIEYKFKDGTLVLNPGEMLIIPPLVSHESIEYNPTLKNFTVISLDIKKSQGDIGFYKAFTDGLERNALKPIKFSNLNKETLLLFNNKKLYETLLGICELKMAMSQVIYAISKKILKDKELKSDDKKMRILIDNLILSPDITLGEIANATNYSKRHLSRLIKEQYGTTFSEIRKNLRREIEK